MLTISAVLSKPSYFLRPSSITSYNHPHFLILSLLLIRREFEKNGNVSAARSLMQQGLRMCKKDESMWSEYFRMELLYIQTLRIRRQVLGIDVPLEPSSMPQGDELGGEEAAANAVLSGAVAGIVIKGAFSALPDSFPIRQKLLDILSSFSFPGIDDLEEKVYASISSDFKGYEEAWRVLAMRPLRDWTKALQKDMDHKEGKVDPYPDPEIHTKVVSKFKVALTALNTSSMHDLFVSYLERHLDQLIKSQASKVASEEASTNGKKRSRGLKSLPKAPEPGPEPSDDVSSAGAELLGAYLSSFAAGSATESLCLRWIQRSEQLGQHRMASVASKKSCERYPGSVELWACRFHLAISHGGEEKATKKQRCSLSRSQELVSLLQEAIKSVPSSGSSSLWLMVLDEVCPSSEESRVGDGGSLFSKLIEMIVYAVTASKGKKGEEGGLGSVAAAFLQRIRVLQGLDAARSFYKRLLSLPSAGAAFLHVALDLEEDCGDHSSTSALHKLYEAAVSNHGSDDVELWLRYARFESKRIHGGLRSTSTGGIYWRACKALPSELHDAFIQKWKNEKI